MVKDQPTAPAVQPKERNLLGRLARRLLAAMVALTVLILLWYGFENYRGKRQWEACKRELISGRVQLDLKALIPPRIPDEQNFAATGFFRDLDFKRSREPLVESSATNSDPHGIHTFTTIESEAAKLKASTSLRKHDRKVTDLVAWQRAFRQKDGQSGLERSADFSSNTADRTKAAEEILQQLTVYEPVLQELRIAIQRPSSRFDVEYDRKNPWEILLPHLDRLKWVCRVTSLKACAELAAGRSERALQDVELMLRVVDAVKSEPILVSYLVRTACLQLATQPIWEGLALGGWSNEQLERLQMEMSRFNFIADEQKVLEGERAVGISTPDLFYQHPKEMLRFITPEIGLISQDTLTPSAFTCRDRDCLLACVVPHGWWYVEQCNYARMFQRYILSGVDFSNATVDSARVDANRTELESKNLSSGCLASALFGHRLIAAMLLPGVLSTHNRAAYAETTVRQGIIACALERYSRVAGTYPSELKLLEGKFVERVPLDVIGAGQMKYKADKRFLLYSVGWDQKDDGGQPTTWLYRENKGDWVWSYPE